MLQVRVSTETRETLKFLADKLGLTVSSYIRMVLLQKIKDEAESKSN